MTFYESITVNPFHVTGLFLYPLKISENITYVVKTIFHAYLFS